MKKTSYPCGISSSGQAWLLHCAECKQVWHNVCAGLKADFTKHVLDSLFRSWQCPWCYTCPYPRSDNHHSVKREQELKDKLLTAETIQCIKESVSKVIERALPTTDLESLENLLSDFRTEIQEFKCSPLTQPSQQISFYEPVEEDVTVNIKCLEAAFSDYINDFLEKKVGWITCSATYRAADSKMFSDGNVHSVLAFGEHYGYTGSKSPVKNDLIHNYWNNFSYWSASRRSGSSSSSVKRRLIYIYLLNDDLVERIVLIV